jgi:RimJ/RimL family protein N-acetyltransferase
LAYNVSHEYWGQGYATEAAKRVLAHCFENTDLRLIEGTCMTDHHASVCILEKAGLTFREIKVQTRRKNGIAYDLKYLTITRGRWMKEQALGE